MKITVLKKLDPTLLGERVIDRYTGDGSVGESSDGMMRGTSLSFKGEIYGTIENETQNADGTYTYDYSSKDRNQYGEEYIRNPNEDKYHLNLMIEELLFKYGIHNFSTDLQEKTNSIKDYYASIDASTSYLKGQELHLSYKWKIYSKDNKEYTKTDNISTYYEQIKTESMDDMNVQLNAKFSKNNYISYLLGEKINKNYKIRLGLDEIGEDEIVKDFLSKISLDEPEIQNIDQALESKMITLEDIEEVLNSSKNIDAKEIPNNILKQIFDKDPELVHKFSERTIPNELLRKYNSNFDITQVNPADLISSDLNNVLQNIIQEGWIHGFSMGPSEQELKQGYLEYLQRFYDNPEALRKIIPVINTARDYFFIANAKEFINHFLMCR